MKSGRGNGLGNSRKLALLPLIAATFFMVSGGPYGTEEVVDKAGYAGALLIFLIVPLLWSLPSALMVSELASALPEEGGFYQWVKRGMGPFWGFQEAWLTLAGSVFDMALYPTLFVYYIAHFIPSLARGHWPALLGLGMIFVCTVWNIFGTRAVGEGSIVMALVLFVPFLALIALTFSASGSAERSPMALGHADWLGAVLIAMWNLMGWDNPSTIAGEVRNPQRTYPLTMAGALLLIVVTYLAPIGAVAHAGIDPNSWTTGGWVDLGRHFGGEGLAMALAAGGVIGAIGSFNALMLSLSRLPLVMTMDGYLPRVFARKHPKTGMPWVAIVACAFGWAVAFRLGFVALAVMDVLLTGLSVLLEFWALVALRVHEPNLPRPYRVPGGLTGAIAIGIGPASLIALAFLRNWTEHTTHFDALSLCLLLIALGPILYGVGRARQRHAIARP
ncbi:MAG TPA: APC family permease [Candidatus Acidoferrales bacterium]|nr:APC family permease [Candidatus Acidoferrales bacterium]